MPQFFGDGSSWLHTFRSLVSFQEEFLAGRQCDRMRNLYGYPSLLGESLLTFWKASHILRCRVMHAHPHLGKRQNVVCKRKVLLDRQQWFGTISHCTSSFWSAVSNVSSSSEMDIFAHVLVGGQV